MRYALCIPMIYTFWDYFRKAWGRNAGLRLDHLLLNNLVADRLIGAGVDRDVRGLPKASDHAPAWIELSTVASHPHQPRQNREYIPLHQK